MVTEQEKTLSALRIAIQMETDGKEFYRKASRESGNEVGRKLLQALSEEEDLHRQKFEHIFESIRVKQHWPKVDLSADIGQGLKTVFARAAEENGSAVRALATELDSVQAAMTMESRSYDFYRAQCRVATYPAEREYYEALAAQEKQHHLILLDYYEYLKDPAGWFVEKEHPSLDGG